MLKLSVGYQYNEDALPFSKIVQTYKESIAEVYFAWIDQPSGRSRLCGFDGYFDYGLQDIMIAELKKIKDMGISLDLLFNANCYGEDAISEVLQGRIVSVIDYLESVSCKPETVTTASPAIAYMVKAQFPDISVKASVNMKIGSVKGMQYVSHLFDQYCVAKECNRNPPLLKEMKAWAEENGKKITILANSGCMRDCSGQIFHDNMVAHEYSKLRRSCGLHQACNSHPCPAGACDRVVRKRFFHRQFTGFIRAGLRPCLCTLCD